MSQLSALQRQHRIEPHTPREPSEEEVLRTAISIVMKKKPLHLNHTDSRWTFTVFSPSFEYITYRAGSSEFLERLQHVLSEQGITCEIESSGNETTLRAI